ncbi:MAG: hypothetical protein JWN66_2048 [Sphingomonas bacterium]|uniref:hypothetical protein n=1 Tax=Sphingomonas bacterium TaxID=1895847 RepID=UPI00260D8B11|nr:hypothetical protein [Sphingomonas bacterium]MDB5704932.1 hypothetical protein [Sphingomonas bacterium]
MKSVLAAPRLCALGALAVAFLNAAPASAQYPQAASLRGLGAERGHSAPIEAFQPSLKCKKKNECIVVVNNNPEYLVSGFFINEGQVDVHGQLKWSDNLFRSDFVLQLHKAWWIHRSTELGCIIQAQVKLRERKRRNHEWETGVRSFDLCKDDIPYTIIYVNPLPKGEVEVTPDQ